MMNNDAQIPIINVTTNCDASPTVMHDKQNSRETTLAWSHIHVQCRQPSTGCCWFRRTKAKTSRSLLHDISGVVRSGQVVAVMGTSGAGKTTLLKALSGQDDSRTTVTAGEILIDGHKTTKFQRLNGSIIGLVEQNELFVETMSLEEHLIFQAMLRMSRAINDNERRARVHNTIALLALNQCAQTSIHRLSGGERKRLAFATVLLTDPRIILIDEPTSGLDSYLSKTLMKMIQNMAVEQHRIIVVVLHQPTSDMFNLLDSLCLLTDGGRQAFFGPVNRASQFFSLDCGLSAVSLSNYIEQLAAPLGGADQTFTLGNMVADVFAQSTHARIIANDISALMDQNSMNEFGKRILSDLEGNDCHAGFVRQLRWLLWRTWVAHQRYPMHKISLLVQTLLMSLMLGFIFFRLQPVNMEYEQNLNAIILVMFFSLLESNMSLLLVGIPAERARIIRDSKLQIYSLYVYYLSRWITDMCLIILSSFCYISIVGFLVGMRRRLLMICVGTLEVFTACGLASFVASLASSPQVALLVLQPMQISLAQFSGFYMNLHSIPDNIVWMQHISYIHYGYKLMLMTQWHNVTIPCNFSEVLMPTDTPSLKNQNVCNHSGNDILNFHGVDPDSFSLNIMFLTILGIIFHVAAFAVHLIRLRRVA